MKTDFPRHFTPRKGLFRFSGLTLLGSLVFLLVASPFLEDLPWGDAAANILFSLTLLSSLLAVGGRRGVLAAGILTVAPALTLRWLYHLPFLGLHDSIPLLSMAVAIGFTVVELLRFVLRAGRVDTEVLCSGLSIYLLAALFWGHLYVLVDVWKPGSFSPSSPGGPPITLFNAVYFSFSTLTTAGYGDIAPVSRYARSLASLEAVGGVLYMAVMISRLVSLYSAAPAAKPDQGSSL